LAQLFLSLPPLQGYRSNAARCSAGCICRDGLLPRKELTGAGGKAVMARRSLQRTLSAEARGGEGSPQEVFEARRQPLIIAAYRAAFALATEVMRTAWARAAVWAQPATCPNDASVFGALTCVNGQVDGLDAAWCVPGHVLVAEGALHRSREEARSPGWRIYWCWTPRKWTGSGPVSVSAGWLDGGALSACGASHAAHLVSGVAPRQPSP
jgi:hypothetical protein